MLFTVLIFTHMVSKYTVEIKRISVSEMPVALAHLKELLLWLPSSVSSILNKSQCHTLYPD